eukprot:3993791-Prymnesium_polylepis.1
MSPSASPRPRSSLRPAALRSADTRPDVPGVPSAARAAYSSGSDRRRRRIPKVWSRCPGLAFERSHTILGLRE